MLHRNVRRSRFAKVCSSITWGMLVASMVLSAAVARAAKPEDVFKGKIFITKDRLPDRFPSTGAFINAVQSKKIDKVWPIEEKGPDHGVWKLEYIAFFAQPLDDNEIQLKFFDITGGERKFVAADPQYTTGKNMRVFGSNIELAKPEFDVNKHYMMTMYSRGKAIATTTFWLRGKGANYSGKVEFSDEETRKK
jgi:hypothetical protein